jgi:hypothetical protein
MATQEDVDVFVQASDALCEGVAPLDTAEKGSVVSDADEGRVHEGLMRKPGQERAPRGEVRVGLNGSSPADAMMRGVVDVFAQYERALIRTRTVSALAAKRAKGEKTGGDAPFGFQVEADGVHLAPVEAEQVVIRGVRDLAASGMSQRAIVRELAARGCTSRAGKPLNQTQVCRILAA